MGYLSNYLYFTRGSECPEAFWRWSAISLASHILGKKCWFMHGFIPIDPALYVAMIGSSGSGKSTAKNEVVRLVRSQFPEMLMSSSVQSREDIIDLMIEDSGRTWEHPDIPGQFQTFNPFYVVANEFESFLSVNPNFMIQFLVDIFDTGHYAKGFKKDRGTGKKSDIDNPYMSLLACGVPEWFMRELKMTMFSGGLGRRMILVVDEATEAVHRPYRPHDAPAYRQLVQEHLEWLFFLRGEIKESDSAGLWWKEWYYRHKKAKPLDPILSQFWTTKHVMLQKLAMLLSTDDKPSKLMIKDEHYEVGLSMLDLLTPKIEQLTSGVGRNVVAGFTGELLAMLREGQGMMSSMRLRLLTYRNAPGGMKGYDEALNYIIDTRQAYKLIDDKPDESGKIQEWVLLPANYEKWKESKK